MLIDGDDDREKTPTNRIRKEQERSLFAQDERVGHFEGSSLRI